MEIDRRQGLKGMIGLAATTMAAAGTATRAFGQTRAETLRHVTGATFTSLDPTLQGATRESLPLSVNIYDRLASFGRKPATDGFVFDMDNIRGELAEKIDRSGNGTTFTFHIREGAKWHDGSPVEAADVKWSLDRGVLAPTNTKTQLANGSMTSTDQFKIVGDRQVEVKVEKPDRLTLPTFCVPFVPMFNSKQAKRGAGADDPWAINWLKDNTAAGGAYMVESNRPGQQLVLKRNDAWKNGEKGALPFFQRIIAQTIPDISSRTSLLERGDADLTLDAAASDIPGIEQRAKARVFAIAQTNAIQCISFNTTAAPFNDPKLRRAIAAALPFDDMFKAAMFGRGRPLFGSTVSDPKPEVFQPMPLKFDLDRARSLLKDAGFADGFKTTFSFPTSMAATAEPMASLIKENLAKLNVDVTVQKLPDPQMVTLVSERKLPFFFDFFTAWLPTADYMTRYFLTSKTRWNSSGWSDPDVTRLGDEARFERDQAKYDGMVKEIITRTWENVPMALLWNPSHDAVIGRDIKGYTYWFHRGADYRDLRREA